MVQVSNNHYYEKFNEITYINPLYMIDANIRKGDISFFAPSRFRSVGGVNAKSRNLKAKIPSRTMKFKIIVVICAPPPPPTVFRGEYPTNQYFSFAFSPLPRRKRYSAENIYHN